MADLTVRCLCGHEETFTGVTAEVMNAAEDVQAVFSERVCKVCLVEDQAAEEG